MKVVFVNYNIYGIGGTVRTSVNLANELCRRGLDVSIISVRRTSDATTLPLDADIYIDPLMDVRRQSENAGRLESLASRVPSLLIHARDDLYSNYSAMADAKLVLRLRALRNCVVITTTPSLNLLAMRVTHPSVLVIGQEHKVFESHHPDLRRRIARSYGHLEALHCITEENAVQYSKMLAGEGVSIRYIPNGTSLDASISGGASRPRRDVVVAAGHLVENKGMDKVIRAFELAHRSAPTWQLEIHGQGPEHGALARLILALGLHNAVFLCGQTTNLPGVLATSSVFALGSRFESFGMVLIEAMSQYVPCVAFDSAGPRALIESGRDGIIVPQDDVEGFGAALGRLMNDSDLRNRMGSAARESVARYDVRRTGDEWVEWLDELSARRARKAK